MRTTLVLADDVVAELERRRRERGVGLSDEVNRLVRLGLVADEARPARREPYVTPVSPSGGLLIASLDDVATVLDDAEGPWRPE